MGFFSKRRNKIIEKEIENAFLLNGELLVTNIHWEAFERFAQEHGGKTDKHADGGQDTAFEMVTNGIEVRVIAVRDKLDGTACLKVESSEEVNKQVDKFLKEHGARPSSSAIEEDEEEDEYYDVTDQSNIDDAISRYMDAAMEESEAEEALAKSIGTGEHIEYHENGKIKSKRTYKDTKLVGKWIEWDEDGQISLETDYKDGEINGKEIFYEDGQISTETDYKDGNKHGKEIHYEDGQKWWELDFKRGWKNGKEINYEDGLISREIDYKDGNKHGKDLTYYKGKLLSEENYKDDEQHGETIFYDEDGKIR